SSASGRSRTTMVRWLNGLMMPAARPRPRGWKRFMTRLLPTDASATIRRSTSRLWLFSALAIAEFSAFFTSCAMRFLEKVSSFTADDAFLPRMVAATRSGLRGLTRTVRSTALASFSASRRLLEGLLIAALLLRDLLVARVGREGAGRRELAELVTDHLLGDVHRDEFPAVVDAERQADELRQDRAAPRPGLDHFAAHAAARLLGLLDQAAFDEGALPDGTCHCLSPSASHGGDG